MTEEIALLRHLAVLKTRENAKHRWLTIQMTGENALRRRLKVEYRRNRPNRTIERFFLFFIISFYFIYLFIEGEGGRGGKRAKYVVRGGEDCIRFSENYNI